MAVSFGLEVYNNNRKKIFSADDKKVQRVMLSARLDYSTVLNIPVPPPYQISVQIEYRFGGNFYNVFPTYYVSGSSVVINYNISGLANPKRTPVTVIVMK